MPISSRSGNTESSESLLSQENVNDLARTMISEAGGENETAQAMVGWVVINRMKKDHSEQVSSVWAHGNFAHSHMATGMSLHLSERILSGDAIDISQGATHFYSPKSMPKEGDALSSRIDTRGGLESVPGVTKNGRATRNYRPRWATTSHNIRVPGIQDKDFKFFRFS